MMVSSESRYERARWVVRKTHAASFALRFCSALNSFSAFFFASRRYITHALALPAGSPRNHTWPHKQGDDSLAKLTRDTTE